MFHGGHQENPEVIKIGFHLKVLAIKLCIHRGIVFWFISVCESSSPICIQTLQIDVNSMIYKLCCRWKHFARSRHSCTGLKDWEGSPSKSSSVRS